VSNGKFLPRFHLVEKWLTSEHSMSYYGSDYDQPACGSDLIDSANACTVDLVREVVAQAEGQNTPFQAYAHNNKLHLILIHAGENQAKSSILHGNRQSLLHTKWQFLETPIKLRDGTEIQSYVLVSEEDGIAAISHEIGHELGLPELYDPDQSSDGIGIWGLMSLQTDLDNPVGMSAWSRSFLGWQPTVVVNRSGNYEITPETIFKVPITDSEYFLLENRQQTGFDSELPGSGVLIWHVDESVQNKQNPLFLNSDETHRFLDLEEAHDLSQDLDVGNDANLANQLNYGEEEDAWYFEPQIMKCKGLADLRIFPRCHQSDFTPYSNPNSNSNSGAVTNISIMVQSEPGRVMNVAIIIPENQPATQYVIPDIPEPVKNTDSKAPTTNALLMTPSNFLESRKSPLSTYSMAFVIFMIDLVLFVAVTSRKGGG
jgi:M6 family metalloprotease-like protein